MDYPKKPSADTKFLKQTLILARKGLGSTFPNPMVGAVIVKNGKIIAKGYHKKAGLPHAEIEAIKSATEDTNGSTLYVNLEPCCHFGKTPPCTNAIINAGIKHVVCSTLDPNPKVSGRGVKILEKAGIKVSVGLLKNEARKLNEAFFTFHNKKRPFIALKFASSLDGKLATYTGNSKWITNEKARNFARSLRREYQAILVGINTVIKDDPHLGVRIRGKQDPLRIILDPKLKIPLNARLLRDKNILIATSSKSEIGKRKLLQEKGIEILFFPQEKIPVKKLLFKLKKKDIISILIEGGSVTLGEFVDEKLFDKVYAFYAPVIIGGNKASTTIGGQGVKNVKDALLLTPVLYRHFGDNYLVIYNNSQ